MILSRKDEDNKGWESGPQLKPGEYLVDLIRGNLKLIQSHKGYSLNMDAVLLAHFVTLGKYIADLGTGNGVIPLLLTTRAASLRIWGIEIQETLIDRAQRSIEINKLGNQIFLEKGDIREISKRYPSGLFDVVVCNPPFWVPGRGRSSSRREMVIAREEIYCNFMDVVKAGDWLLRQGGRMALIHLWERRQEVFSVFEKHGLKLHRWRKVMHTQESAPNRILVEAIKSDALEMARHTLKCLIELTEMPPLIVYNLAGEFTPEVKAMYYD